MGVVKSIATEYRKKGNDTRIWLISTGFKLLVKDKSNKCPWSKIRPMVLPLNMPLAEIGKMSPSTEIECKRIEDERTKQFISNYNIRDDINDIKMKEYIIRTEEALALKESMNKRPLSQSSEEVNLENEAKKISNCEEFTLVSRKHTKNTEEMEITDSISTTA